MCMAKRSEEWKRRRSEVLPGRLDWAKKRFAQAGIPLVKESDMALIVRVRCHNVTYYPFTGWFFGKGIKDGRGLENLIKQCQAGNHQ